MRGRYGVDAPAVPVWLVTGGVVLVAWGIGLLSTEPRWTAVFPFAGGAVLLASAASYLYTTRAGKFVVWRGLLGELGLRGDERVLDAGCGRGAVLTAVAALVPSGRVTGVDLWRSADQSGNRESATLANATAEGVADRVELVTADLRELPWTEPHFDVALSALAIHNIKRPGDRDRAVTELARVLRPGGKLVITDIGHTAQYHAALAATGMSDIRVAPCGWRYWFGFFVRTKAVTATR